jgi:hypothetical protein
MFGHRQVISDGPVYPRLEENFGKLYGDLLVRRWTMFVLYYLGSSYGMRVN